ncbi:uncharacterized protein LOC131944782 [Physella acuta]|uniref:uncharacterized protein LOC131944782 n=1 Tax=Physella acuta TaxID=109671 RepID=UPI0027DE032A|nr:uncharacterized protein LOC131944782 [Physella acuta]XP_059161580.1 uncharacterized protein LOC131944782 [Physella acuta]
MVETDGRVAALSVSVLGCVLQVVGLATPHWAEGNMFNTGLWVMCHVGTCGELVDKPDWLVTCQVLSVIGLTLSAVAVIVSAVIFLTAFTDRPHNINLDICLLVTGIAACLATSSCCCIYVLTLPREAVLEYSFYLSTFGGGVSLVGGVSGCIISRRCNNSKS